MKKSPLFAKHVTNSSQSDYRRNIWCSYYRFCMAEAANRDCFLSCNLCPYNANFNKAGRFG